MTSKMRLGDSTLDVLIRVYAFMTVSDPGLASRPKSDPLEVI
jgi:hypothetical protein